VSLLRKFVIVQDMVDLLSYDSDSSQGPALKSAVPTERERQPLAPYILTHTIKN